MLTNTDLLETCKKDVTILWAYLIRPFRVITDFRLISRQNYIVTHKKIPDSNMRRYNFNNFSRSMYHVFFSIIQYFSIYHRKHAVERWHDFPPTPHLISVSALPCKTENTDITYFQLNVEYCFTNKHAKHVLLKTKCHLLRG